MDYSWQWQYPATGGNASTVVWPSTYRSCTCGKSYGCGICTSQVKPESKPEFTRHQALELAIQHNAYWDSPSDITLLVAEQFYNYLNGIGDAEVETVSMLDEQCGEGCGHK